MILVSAFVYACEDQSEEIKIEVMQEEKSEFATNSASIGAAMRSGNEYD